MKLLRILLAEIFLYASLVVPTFAQQVPVHSVPIGLGGGNSGYNSAAPGTAGTVLKSNGASADPSFGTLTNAALPAGVSGSVKCSLAGSVQDCSGVDLNTLNAKSANYPIVPADAGSTIYVSGGPFTVTLPSVSGFASNAVVGVCNGNANNASSRAVLLSGFPAQFRPRLYMQQCLLVAIMNGVWVPKYNPGVFVPQFTPSIYVDPAGNNANDGLTAVLGTGVTNPAVNAVADPQTCINILQQEMAIYGGPPNCLLTSGGVFTVPTVTFSRGNGYGVIDMYGNGGIATVRTNSNVVFEMYDFGGYIIFANIQFDCSLAASHPCYGLFIHQQNGVDLGSGNAGSTFPNYFNGGGTTDLGIWCDSQCKINSAQPVVFTGTFANALRVDLSGVAAINNGMTITGANFADNIIQLSGGSQLVWSGQLTAGGGVSTSKNVLYASGSGTNARFATYTLSGSISGGQAYLVVNNAWYCNGGAVALPGTAGSVTQAASSNGTAVGPNGNCSP